MPKTTPQRLLQTTQLTYERKLLPRMTLDLEMLQGKETYKAVRVKQGRGSGSPRKESNPVIYDKRLLSKMRWWLYKKPGFKT